MPANVFLYESLKVWDFFLSEKRSVFAFLYRTHLTRTHGGPETCQHYFSASHPQKSKAALDQKSWKPQVVPSVDHKWHTDTTYEIDLVKAQNMGLQIYPPFSYAVVEFGDVPADCVARLVETSISSGVV